MIMTDNTNTATTSRIAPITNIITKVFHIYFYRFLNISKMIRPIIDTTATTATTEITDARINSITKMFHMYFYSGVTLSSNSNLIVSLSRSHRDVYQLEELTVPSFKSYVMSSP